MTAGPRGCWKGITALVLCGGLGTRLRPVVADRPKGIADVAGRPFLGRLLDQIAVTGIGKTILCTGHMADLIERECRHRHGNMELAYSVESQPLGTGGALRLALDQVDTPEIVVMNGDSYCHVDLDRFYAAFAAAGHKPMLVLASVPDVSRYGQVDYGPDGRIRRFVEKATVSGNGLVNAGIYLMPTDIAYTIPEGRPISLERDVFPAWIDAGLGGFPCAGPFIDIGTPDTYREAAEFFSHLEERYTRDASF